MKQARITAFILIMLAIAVSSCLYADSFRFSIVWDKTVTSITSLSVVVREGSVETDIETKELVIDSAIQDVAEVKYVSTEGGTHVLSYKATTLTNNTESSGHSFNLFFVYTDENSVEDTQVIQVGPDKTRTYPVGSGEAATQINMGQGGAHNVNNPKYVQIRVQLPESTINSMQVGTYSSTITIERTSP